ncbi:hypothetical protein EJ02DRAFT_338653 [Clathrospora elynae]|uniref:Uncharacterized protein n=1 Tax=Clathrospora elynae TaxID=706981 RepID=A0A6A5T414_9PLEO|nr:hypothetical protein EJ02DRAFT_338653 [Clathrospora elynae]
MVPKISSAASNSLLNSTIPNTGFRLGEEGHFSDASDSDQSAGSERSLSSTRGNRRVTKSKRQKDRRKMGALADELVDVLADAFAAPNADPQAAVATATGQVDGDQIMEVDVGPDGKKMNKRTRQNLAKMQARKEKNGSKCKDEASADYVLRTQTAAAERRGMTLEDYRKLRKRGGGRNTTKASARRLKKEAIRTKKAAAEEDRMEIG